jgi:hypothetical protein
MGVVQLHRPDDLTRVIDQQIAESRTGSEADFVLAAGRYMMVTTLDQSQAQFEAAIAFLRARMPSDIARH